MFAKCKRAQGALEYLLLIGGAVIISVLVIAIAVNIPKTTENSLKSSAGCVSILGCSTCKKNPSCSGFTSGKTELFKGSSGASDCDSDESRDFLFCGPGGG